MKLNGIYNVHLQNYKGQLKRNVFRVDLNTSQEGASRTSIGSLFHNVGAATQKARSPYLVRVRGPGANCKWAVEDERSLIEDAGVLSDNKSLIYGGASPCLALYVSRRTLKTIR